MAHRLESEKGFVHVRGAREHNLKHVDLKIPRDALVVFTGVSGSGKSSLAFGTLYAEAQRRYLESVSPYARRLFHQMPVPQVDAGNTVILVEHDMDVIRRSDWVIDIGPGAGDEGGTIVAAGTPAAVASVRDSKTGRYLKLT